MDCHIGYSFHAGYYYWKNTPTAVGLHIIFLWCLHRNGDWSTKLFRILHFMGYYDLALLIFGWRIMYLEHVDFILYWRPLQVFRHRSLDIWIYFWHNRFSQHSFSNCHPLSHDRKSIYFTLSRFLSRPFIHLGRASLSSWYPTLSIRWFVDFWYPVIGYQK